MEIKQDLRVARTYKLLTDALLQLMEELPFEDITINILCERAMIRRTTFYKHFSDKYDFFDFMVKDIQKKFNEEAARKTESATSRDYYVQIIQNTLGFLEQNDSLVQSVIKSKMFPILLNIVAEEIAFDVCLKLKDDKKRGITLLTDPELMANIFTGALISAGKWWITKKGKVSRKEIVNQLAAVIMRM